MNTLLQGMKNLMLNKTRKYELEIRVCKRYDSNLFVIT